MKTPDFKYVGVCPNELIDDRSTRAKNILDEVIEREKALSLLATI